MHAASSLHDTAAAYKPFLLHDAFNGNNNAPSPARTAVSSPVYSVHAVVSEHRSGRNMRHLAMLCCQNSYQDVLLTRESIPAPQFRKLIKVTCTRADVHIGLSCCFILQDYSCYEDHLTSSADLRAPPRVSRIIVLHISKMMKGMSPSLLCWYAVLLFHMLVSAAPCTHW